MKGYGSGGVSAAAQLAAKRRWKGKAAAVFGLFIFSLLVPLAFLLGLHNRFPSGYMADDRSQQESSFETYRNVDRGRQRFPSEGDQWKLPNHKDKFAPAIPKDVDSVPPEELNKRINKTVSALSILESKNDRSQATAKDDKSKTKGPVESSGPSRKSPSSNTRTAVEDRKQSPDTGFSAYETDISCEHEFGSYCLWSQRHREVMKDSIVKRLKDQLFVARAYYPSIAKIQGKETLARELKMNIQDHERMLSEAVSDPDLPPLVGKKIKNMDNVIAKSKSCRVDCNNVDRKLRQILDLTEDEAHFHMKQSAFLYQLGVQTMSKTIHCLLMRLTVEFFKSPSVDMQHSLAYKIDNPSYAHYVIFSRNVLALSVTINSTVMNSKEPDSMVFHVLTDKQNFFSMKHWFARHLYREATIHILNFDELKSNHFSNMDLGELSMPEEFHISSHTTTQPFSLHMNTKYLSGFSHSHFLLPDVFKNLKKVILLDDDVVVQKDISFLWNLNMGGKVVAATEFCGVKLGQLKSYLGATGYDCNSCAWMSGINKIDLEKWRELDITGVYQSLVHKQGLGHDYGVSEDTVNNVAALHYNGNMKPWLDLAIPKYKKYWKSYLTQDERYMEECNVNP